MLPIHPRLGISRPHVAAIIVTTYVGLVAGAALLFRALERSRGYEEVRSDQMTILFAVVAAVPLIVQLTCLYRQPALCDFVLPDADESQGSARTDAASCLVHPRATDPNTQTMP
jgi:hypothetical protein